MISKETFLTFLLVCIFGIWISKANAEMEDGVQTINAVIPCNELRFIAHNLMEEYNEVPVASGKGGLKTDRVPLSGKFIVFINPESRTFTVVLKMGDEEEAMACIVAAGNDFGPALDAEQLMMLGAVRS